MVNATSPYLLVATTSFSHPRPGVSLVHHSPSSPPPHFASQLSRAPRALEVEYQKRRKRRAGGEGVGGRRPRGNAGFLSEHSKARVRLSGPREKEPRKERQRRSRRRRGGRERRRRRRRKMMMMMMKKTRTKKRWKEGGGRRRRGTHNTHPLYLLPQPSFASPTCLPAIF